MKIKGDKYLQEKFGQYQSGSLSDQEKTVIDDWFKERMESTPLAIRTNHFQAEEIRSAVYRKLQRRISQQNKKQHYVKWLKIACILFLISSIGTLTLHQFQEARKPEKGLAQIFSTGNAQYKRITLQDGTQIWLNAATRLRVDAGFKTSNLRKVYLEYGEAFFQVKRDTLRPFKIMTQNFITTVLGTSFNITSYPELDTYKVAVASGKVKVDYVNHALAKELVPNEVLTYNLRTKRKIITKQEVSLWSGWRLNQSVYLENLTLSQIGVALSRKYNIQVKTASLQRDHRTYTLYLVNQPVQQAVQRIALITGMSYQLTQHTLILNPNPFSMKKN